MRDGTRILQAVSECPICTGKQYRTSRTRGIAAGRRAQGEYVGYLDDDAKASAGWLSAVGDIVTKTHPEALGGPFYPFYNSPKPAWYKDEYGLHVQGNEARALMKNEYLDGGNMFIRREHVLDLRRVSGGIGHEGWKDRLWRMKLNSSTGCEAK